MVHPWYLAALVALSPFVRYRFALIWTALAPLSYITYQTLPYQQNYWLIALEYLIVGFWMVFEMRQNNEWKSAMNAQKRGFLKPLTSKLLNH
ncbi:MAG TPA: hypothetical protein VEV16_02575 [Daejeonella sp.]|nr:hypothetical protein [Daejeonella sp.]